MREKTIITSMSSLNPTKSHVVLTEVQIEAASMLAMGMSKTDIAEECRIDRSTLYAWMDIPEFQMHVGQSKGQTQKLYQEATDKLVYQMFRGWKQVLKDTANRNYGKVCELICKIKGMMDVQPNIAFIILNSPTPDGQAEELMRRLMDMIPMMSEQGKQRLLNGFDVPVDQLSDQSIEAEFTDIDEKEE